MDLTRSSVLLSAHTATGLLRSSATCRVTYKHTLASSHMCVIYVARLTLTKARCSSTSVYTLVRDHTTAPSASRHTFGPQITGSISAHTPVRSPTSVTLAERISFAPLTCESMSGTCTPTTSPSHARTVARPLINPSL